MAGSTSSAPLCSSREVMICTKASWDTWKILLWLYECFSRTHPALKRKYALASLLLQFSPLLELTIFHSKLKLQSWPKCVGQSAFSQIAAIFACSPLPPPPPPPIRDIDCLNVEITHKSACNFHITQRMDVKLDMVNVRDLLHVFHPNVAIWGKILTFYWVAWTYSRVWRTFRTRGDLIEVTNSRVFVTSRLRLTPWGDCFAVLECCNIVTHDIMFDVSSAEHCMTVLTYKSVFSCRKKISCFSVLHTIVHQLRFIYAKTYSMYQLAIFMVFEQCSVIRKRSYE